MRRPNPVLWVFYSFGGRLPDRYRDWVLHDGTCRTWLLRVFVRGLVQVAPFAVALVIVFWVFGHSWPLAVGAVVLGLVGMLRYRLSYSVESVNSRLSAYGFPPGHGTAVRKQRYAERHADEAAAYRATWRGEGN